MTDEDEFELDWSKARLVKPASEHDLIRRGDALAACHIEPYCYDSECDSGHKLRARIAALERVKAEARSDVAGLVEALRRISATPSYRLPPPQDIARAALAAWEGGE
jgi:hypothetical protein